MTESLKSNSFISAIQKSEIIASQTLGIINREGSKLGYFLGGVLNNIRIIPAETPSTYTLLGINFSDYIQYHPPSDVITSSAEMSCMGSRPIYLSIHDEKDTIYPSKSQFENEMKKLMESFKKNSSFPIFVREMSKLPNWKP